MWYEIKKKSNEVKQTTASKKAWKNLAILLYESQTIVIKHFSVGSLGPGKWSFSHKEWSKYVSGWRKRKFIFYVIYKKYWNKI